MKSKQSEVTACGLLQQHGLYETPVKIDALAKKLGISIQYEPLEDNFSAFLLIKHGKARIFVNSHHHPNRQRFSVSHEIGHFVLHHHGSKKADGLFLDKTFHLYTRRHGRSDSINYEWEREANRFAAELLMPEKLVKDYVIKHELDITDEFDIYRLAVAFGVSEQALLIRLTQLKLAGFDW